MAGTGLVAVPVAVAAMIGFGTSLSGVAGGLLAVTSGPDAVSASAPTGPNQLNRAVVALASSRQGSASTPGTAGGLPTNTGSSPGSLGGSGGGSGGSDGGSSTLPTDTLGTPSAPDVPLPGGGGSTGQTVDNTSGTLSNVLNGVDQTLNGLLGR